MIETELEAQVFQAVVDALQYAEGATINIRSFVDRDSVAKERLVLIIESLAANSATKNPRQVT